MTEPTAADERAVALEAQIRELTKELRAIRAPKIAGGRTFDILGLLFEETDVTLSEAARRMGVSRQRVHRIYTKAVAAGIPVPRR